MLFPPTIIRNVFGAELAPNWLVVGSIAALALVQTAAVFVGSYIDATWILPGVGKGLLEHYGVWAILIADPLLLIAAGFAYRQFCIAMETLPFVEREGTGDLKSIVRPYFDFIELKGRSVFIYYLLAIVGLLAWVLNLLQTIQPFATYGNDVFDALAYPWGYVGNKFNLFVSWVVVAPAVGFMLVSMSFSTWLILRRVENLDALGPSVLHPDGCYGFEHLGTLNVALLWPYLISFGVMFALKLTHEGTYPSLVVPVIVLAVVCIVVSIVTIQPITSHTKKIRRKTFNSLVEKSHTQEKSTNAERLRFAVERLSFSMTSASPYSKNLSALLNVMRFSPAVLTMVRLLS
ncbi:MAG: hypothetical protein HY834_20485 [Devosia nanyangense]|uniref:Uncharacterized protein n=1 Tax=Devosia nanyangense TaxID=1228055 RepID=A0A933L6R5_9HYPH|nr:hypothetical protein [Devosia nanyangense]